MINWEDNNVSFSCIPTEISLEMKHQQLKALRIIAQELRYLRFIAEVVLENKCPVESKRMLNEREEGE